MCRHYISLRKLSMCDALWHTTPVLSAYKVCQGHCLTEVCEAVSPLVALDFLPFIKSQTALCFRIRITTACNIRTLSPVENWKDQMYQ